MLANPYSNCVSPNSFRKEEEGGLGWQVRVTKNATKASPTLCVLVQSDFVTLPLRDEFNSLPLNLG